MQCDSPSLSPGLGIQALNLQRSLLRTYIQFRCKYRPIPLHMLSVSLPHPLKILQIHVRMKHHAVAIRIHTPRRMQIGLRIPCLEQRCPPYALRRLQAWPVTRRYVARAYAGYIFNSVAQVLKAVAVVDHEVCPVQEHHAWPLEVGAILRPVAEEEDGLANWGGQVLGVE